MNVIRPTHGTSARSIDCQWSRHVLCLTPSTCDCRCHVVQQPAELTIVTTYWDGVTERETFDAQFVLDHFAELAWYARAEGGDYVKRSGNLLRIGRYSDKWTIHVIEPTEDCA